MILINFDINAREDFRLGVPEWGYYAEKFNSDAVEFGGSGVLNEGRIPCEDVAWNGREQSIVLRIPPLAGVVLKKVARQAKPKKAVKAAAKPAAKASAKKPAAKKAPAAKVTARPAAKKSPVKAAVKTAAAAKAKAPAGKKAVKASAAAK